jgi:hypothetical protein
MRENEEDIEALRAILENLIELSFDQGSFNETIECNSNKQSAIPESSTRSEKN